VVAVADPTESALTYEVENRFEDSLPTRALTLNEARAWLVIICEREDLDPPQLAKAKLSGSTQAVAIAESWCILVNDIAPTQHTILHELAHLSCANRGHGKEFRTQLVGLLRKHVSVEHGAHLHTMFLDAGLSVDPFSATG
jgi:hypothetical protein